MGPLPPPPPPPPCPPSAPPFLKLTVSSDGDLNGKVVGVMEGVAELMQSKGPDLRFAAGKMLYWSAWHHSSVTLATAQLPFILECLHFYCDRIDQAHNAVIYTICMLKYSFKMPRDIQKIIASMVWAHRE